MKIFGDDISEGVQSNFLSTVMKDHRVVESIFLYLKRNIVVTSVEKDV